MLIHGFTGAPPEMQLIGDYLHRQGFCMLAPLLPGHGTSVDDMNRHAWTEWARAVEAALEKLSLSYETVFVGGLSLGSLLALYCAAQNTKIAGAILYSPAIRLKSRLIHLTPVVKYIVPKMKKWKEFYTDPQAIRSNWSYDENPAYAAHELLKLTRCVRRLLPQIACPLLMIQSRLDPSIRPDSSRFIYDRVASADKEILMLENSGHCLTIDAEWKTAAEKTCQFMKARLPDLT